MESWAITSLTVIVLAAVSCEKAAHKPEGLKLSMGKRQVSLNQRGAELPNAVRAISERQSYLDQLASYAAGLSDEELWGNIYDQFTDSRSSDELAMLLREFGKRGGSSSFIAISDLLKRDEQIAELDQSLAALIGGWGVIDPDKAGLAILKLCHERRFYSSISKSSKFAYRRAAAEIFGRWAKIDSDAALHALINDFVADHELRVAAYLAIQSADPEKRKMPFPSFIVATESRIAMPVFRRFMSGVMAESAEENNIDAILNFRKPMQRTSSWSGFSDEVDLTNSDFKEATAVIGRSSVRLVLEDWVSRNPISARKTLRGQEVYPQEFRQQIMNSLARRDPDYVSLVEGLPESLRMEMTVGLQSLFTDFSEENVWPVDGLASSWKLNRQQRIGSLRNLLREASFTDSERRDLEALFQSELSE